MRAALIDHYRGLPRVAEVSKPQRDSGQSLVAVRAAVLNPLDLDFAVGHHRVQPPQFPYIPGFEGVRVVVESGTLPSGQRVRIECRPTFAQGGSFAEYALVADEWAFPLPAGVPDGMAAALGQVGVTVWTALEWRAGLRPGEAVLLLGATGATGYLAVQVARLLGAGRIVAAGRDVNALARTRELGADATVMLGPDRSVEALAHAFRDAAGGPVDVVLDALWEHHCLPPSRSSLVAPVSSILAAPPRRQWTCHPRCCDSKGSHSSATTACYRRARSSPTPIAASSNARRAATWPLHVKRSAGADCRGVAAPTNLSPHQAGDRPLANGSQTVGGVRRDLLEARHEVRQTAQELTRTDGVAHVGGGDVPGDGQAECINQQMPLPALDELAAIVAADAPATPRPS